MTTKHQTLRDRKTEEWLVGLRIGLALAEGMSEAMRRAGQIDVLDIHGKLLRSSRIDQLPIHEDAADADEGREVREAARPVNTR